jgi:hypothetical protein
MFVRTLCNEPLISILSSPDTPQHPRDDPPSKDSITLYDGIDLPGNVPNIAPEPHDPEMEMFSTMVRDYLSRKPSLVSSNQREFSYECTHSARCASFVIVSHSVGRCHSIRGSEYARGLCVRRLLL